MTPNFHLGASAAIHAGPLAHVHLLITRPVMPASRTAQRIAALGATPYVFPTILIEPPTDSGPLHEALTSLLRYHAAIFVSPSAAEMTISPFGSAPIELPSSLRVYAPGPGTAEELTARGVSNVEMPTVSFDSEGLLALQSLQPNSINGKRVVIFRGNDGRELLREELTKRGAIVDAITAYQRRSPQGSPTGMVELLRSKKLTAISAMSSDAVTNLVSFIPTSERATLFALPIYVSHERIAQTAKHAGFRNLVVTDAGDAGLITALLNRV